MNLAVVGSFLERCGLGFASQRDDAAPESSLRRMTHSTSFLATGSEMPLRTSSALVCLRLRTISMARFIAETSMAAAVMIVFAGCGIALG
ncbi:MAG: hypothetical protein J0H89_12445 [Rhizobiales bacterium]|nr:hypothetical protein [Hyphomicrobiales bacterium]